MRLISQDGSIDLPYEQTGVVSELVLEEGGEISHYGVYAVFGGVRYPMAKYRYRFEANAAEDEMVNALLCFDKGVEKFYQFGQDK